MFTTDEHPSGINKDNLINYKLLIIINKDNLLDWKKKQKYTFVANCFSCFIMKTAKAFNLYHFLNINSVSKHRESVMVIFDHVKSSYISICNPTLNHNMDEKNMNKDIRRQTSAQLLAAI